jgi:hypothetical protein
MTRPSFKTRPSFMARPSFSLAPAALALALLATPALAQQAAPAAQQPVGSPLMQKAMESKFADSHIDMAAQVLKASGIGVMFQNAVPNVVGSLRVNVTRTRPELTKDIEESLKVVEADVIRVSDDGMKAAARFLAVRMPEAELKEVLTFLNSPVGKKYVDGLPGVTEDIVPFMEIWAPQVEGRLMQVFKDEMLKRGHKL